MVHSYSFGMKWKRDWGYLSDRLATRNPLYSIFKSFRFFYGDASNENPIQSDIDIERSLLSHPSPNHNCILFLPSAVV